MACFYNNGYLKIDNRNDNIDFFIDNFLFING